MDWMRFVKGKLDWFAQVGYVTLNLFLKAEIPNHAAAVAYYFLLAFVPLILLIIFIFNSLLGGYPEMHARFISLISSLDVALNIDPLKSINLSTNSGKLTGGISIVTLLWSSAGLIQSIQSTMDVIFADFEKRSVISGGMISLLVVPISCLVVVLALIGRYLSDHPDLHLTGMPFPDALIGQFFGIAEMVVPVILLWLVVFLAYYRLPAQKPAFLPAIASSMLCTASILGAKAILGHALNVDKYNAIYGSTGEIIFVLIWVYSVCIVFFLWAEFLYASGKIDVIALEKIFMSSGKKSGLASRVENLLFGRSARMFEKYGLHCREGDVIIRQNEDSKSVYYLYKGKIGFYDESDSGMQRIRSLDQGEIFGEMACLLNERRTATAIADTDCFLFAFSPGTFESLMNDSTRLSRRVINALCLRLAR